MSRPAADAPVVVWGAGAVGGSIGGALIRAGQPVLFVEKDPAHLHALNRDGLRITGPVVQDRVPASAVHPDHVRGPFRTVLLCVKAHHTREAAGQVRPNLAADGVVVSVQNGLCELEIADVVGPARTMGAFVNFGADYLGPGVVHRGNRGAVVVGELDGRDTDRVRRIHELLGAFEPDAVLTRNLFGYLWGKLSYAALLFATALTDDPIADVLDRRSHRPVLIELAREVVGVAEARGIELEGFDGFDPRAFRPGAPPADARASLDRLVAFNRGSAKTRTGIWRDLAVRKRPTEVDAQLGAVVRMGEEAGVGTPLLTGVVAMIHDIEAGRRTRTLANLDELDRLARRPA